MPKNIIELPPLEPSPNVTTSPISNETHEVVKDIIQEKIVVQPVIQPLQVQGEQQPIIFQTVTANPTFEETITEAEKWAWKTIAIPVRAKGVEVYNDNIPRSIIVRPREYVVMSVDDEVRDTNFGDNRNTHEESLCTWVIQGQGNTFENWVVEVGEFIHELLRQERRKGKVRGITNRNIGYDETLNLLTRTISCWYRYKN